MTSDEKIKEAMKASTNEQMIIWALTALIIDSDIGRTSKGKMLFNELKERLFKIGGE